MASSVVASSSFSMSCFSCARSARISSNRLFKRPNSLIFSWSSNLTYRMGMFISMGYESTRPHEHLRQLPLLDLMPWFQWATFCGISSKFTMRMNDNKFWSNKPLITRNTNAKFISKTKERENKIKTDGTYPDVPDLLWISGWRRWFLFFIEPTKGYLIRNKNFESGWTHTILASS